MIKRQNFVHQAGWARSRGPRASERKVSTFQTSLRWGILGVLILSPRNSRNGKSPFLLRYLQPPTFLCVCLSILHNNLKKPERKVSAGVSRDGKIVPCLININREDCDEKENYNGQWCGMCVLDCVAVGWSWNGYVLCRGRGWSACGEDSHRRPSTSGSRSCWNSQSAEIFFLSRSECTFSDHGIFSNMCILCKRLAVDCHDQR